MQILPGVYLINGFPYGLHQNGYLVQTPDAAIVIDSGDMEEPSFSVVESACHRWGFSPSRVSHLLLTHAHFDHASHAARFRAFGASIVASQDTAEAIAAGDERCIGYAMSSTFEPCQADIILHDGETLDLGGLAVCGIAAPGHTNGLMIYEIVVNGERVWFVGDLVEVGPECATLTLGWPGSPDHDPATYLETLRKLTRLPCDTLLPGHGPPAIGLAKKLIDKAFTTAMVARCS